MLDGRFRFDNFVVGVANRLAASAARAVAEAPGAAYNPLCIYSSSGLGKTHLLGAVGHHARALHPDLATEYLSLEEIVAQLHQAIAAGQSDAFKRRYAGVGLLLIDDVQFLAGRPETQSELLRVFNALQGSGRQLVMTCDRPPTEIADVDERLISRLTGGLLVDMGVPDYETRVAILRHKCSERDAHLAAGVLEELALTPAGSVRELEGALNRLMAHQSLLGVAVEVADVWPVLGLGVAAPAPVPDEFEAFLTDISVTVAESVDTWRVKLGERIARWSGEGFHTGRLERVLERPQPPDLDALEAAFAADAERLRALEAEAVRLDPSSAGLVVFRDPDRVADAESFLATTAARYDPLPGPREGFRLQDLVRTAKNRMAVEAAMAVLDAPGRACNPLFVHGPRGSGKSHLAHGLGHAFELRAGDTPVVACVDAAAFVEELIRALQDGSLERWRARYRGVDVLIVDDVQHLAGKEGTQDEFFHLFNALQQGGRQLVLTADVAPSQLAGLQPRLRSRFEGGLVVETGVVDRNNRWGRRTPTIDGEPSMSAALDAMIDEVVSTAGEPAHFRLESMTRPEAVLDPFFLDAEKVVDAWPVVDGRVVEEMR